MEGQCPLLPFLLATHSVKRLKTALSSALLSGFSNTSKLLGPKTFFFQEPSHCILWGGSQEPSKCSAGSESQPFLCKHSSSPSVALWVMLSSVCGDMGEESTPSRLKHWQILQIPINYSSFLLTSSFI